MPTEPLPRADARPLKVQIDGHAVSVPDGTSVLGAAELAGVHIPSLCWHKELSGFGGCRLCMVEIAGMRGYPLACSTPAQQDMKVTTESVVLKEMRREILQLILSEHPSSCLFCGEADECRRNQMTIRKAGVSTGCRSCPNDGDCELQQVVERVGVTDVGHPITYRGLEAEHDDPFYDRDYNLCILCGRCVRMCAEVRGTSVLAFKYRGRKALIGPAFGTSHVEAGCEFCGACVSVCPTGALADKVSKWDGKADGLVTSTCPFCSLGCRLELAHKGGVLSWARGAHDAEINDGQLCVRGRFCLPETTHHYERARKPMVRRGAYFRVVDWDEALGEVAARLKEVAADELLMLVSSDLSNEGLFAAQRLVRSGLGSQGIDSSGLAYLSGGPAAWSSLFSLPISMKALGEAETVVVAGLDSRFSFSVAGVQIRRAMRRGAKLVAVDARESNLAQAADEWVRAQPGEEARALVSVLRGIEHAGTLAVVVGPRVFDSMGAGELVAELEAVGSRQGTTILPLVHGANIRGALELGALSGVLPGPRAAAVGDALTLASLRAGRRPKVLYLVGEAPFPVRPDCDFLIAQDLYLPPFDVDVFLPAASFVEAEGTLTSIEGRVQELARVEDLPAGAVHGFALPDWKIFADLAGRLDHADLQYADAAGVRAAIRAAVAGFPADGDRSPRRMKPMAAARGKGRAAGKGPAGKAAATAGETAAEAPEGKGRFLLVPEHAGFRHRGIDLPRVVEGLAELHLEEGLRMNADDMARLGVEPGGAVTINVDGARHDGGAAGSVRLVLAARADPDCPRGAVYASGLELWGGPTRPVRIRVSAGDRSRSARPPRVAVAGAARSRARGGEHVQGR